MLLLNPISFINLRSVEVEAIRWKLKLEGLKKKPSVEMWRFRDQCLLEISAKFKELAEASQALNAIKQAIPEKPSLIQGSKTGWVLDNMPSIL